MGMLMHDYRRDVSDSVGMASAADVYTWYPGGPCEVVRFGIIATTSSGFIATAASSFTMVGDLLSKASAKDAGYTRGDADVGTLNSTSSADTGYAGNVVYTDCSSPINVDVGEGIIFQVTSVASAGATARVFVEYRDLPWQGYGRPTSAPGDGAGSGSIQNTTKV